MAARRVLGAFLLAWLAVGRASAQSPAPAPVGSQEPASTPAALDELTAMLPVEAPALQTIPLRVEKGTPLQVALDQEVHIHKAGQAIHGKIVQPVYAFDHIVVPAGTDVEGEITKVGDISGKRRTLSILDANFTPDHAIELEFNTLVLADGSRIPVHTVVAPGSGRVLEFVKAKDSDEHGGPKGAVSKEVSAAKEEAKKAWDEAMKQAKEPGKMHRLERYAVAQLPVHPQYLDAGTLYSAELQEPLEFGSEPLTPQMAASIGATPPEGSLVHALLLTSLSSATSQIGDPVEAVLWQPLFDGDKLILPSGSLLKGTVLQARPAHKPHHNGQLRIVFHQLVPPDGVERKVNALVAGVDAARSDHLELDSEGGAEAVSPPTRYLTTALAIALAHDAAAGNVGGNASNRVAGGVGGFKLIGFALGVFVHSQPLGMAMGAAGASRSIYTNFIGPGQEVVFPRDTAMEISLSVRPGPPAVALPKPEADSKP
jgi:hypothetical protein